MRHDHSLRKCEHTLYCNTSVWSRCQPWGKENDWLIAVLRRFGIISAIFGGEGKRGRVILSSRKPLMRRLYAIWTYGQWPHGAPDPGAGTRAFSRWPLLSIIQPSCLLSRTLQEENLMLTIWHALTSKDQFRVTKAFSRKSNIVL